MFYPMLLDLSLLLYRLSLFGSPNGNIGTLFQTQFQIQFNYHYFNLQIICRFYIDPALSLVLVILILRSVWPLLKDSALILLQTVPTHIQVCVETKNLYTYIAYLHGFFSI